MPLYSRPGASDYNVYYMLELLLASLNSYFAHGNQHDVLVTTNDRRAADLLSRYRSRAQQRFALAYVTQEDLAKTFGLDEFRLQSPLCLCYVLSKFYPIVRQFDRQIVHVDYDTLFMSRVDFSRLRVSDIGLVDTNQFGTTRKWMPNSAMIEFFRMRRGSIRPVAGWINSGVFSIQQRGFDLCGQEVESYLAKQAEAVAAGYSDETIMNALAVRESEMVAVIPDFRFNFLAYCLGNDRNWLKTSKIIHFHGTKPHIFRCSNGSVQHHCRVHEQRRLTDDFYMAVLHWCSHLHAACRYLDFDFPMLQAMPLDVVQREQRRVAAGLDSRRGQANKLRCRNLHLHSGPNINWTGVKRTAAKRV